MECGIRKGRIDCEELESSIRSAFPEITWVSARISGTRLLVQVKENEVLSEIPPKNETPCDLTADYDGTITNMIVPLRYSSGTNRGRSKKKDRFLLL